MTWARVKGEEEREKGNHMNRTGEVVWGLECQRQPWGLRQLGRRIKDFRKGLAWVEMGLS